MSSWNYPTKSRIFLLRKCATSCKECFPIPSFHFGCLRYYSECTSARCCLPVCALCCAAVTTTALVQSSRSTWVHPVACLRRLMPVLHPSHRMPHRRTPILVLEARNSSATQAPRVPILRAFLQDDEEIVGDGIVSEEDGATFDQIEAAQGTPSPRSPDAKSPAPTAPSETSMGPPATHLSPPPSAAPPVAPVATRLPSSAVLCAPIQPRRRVPRAMVGRDVWVLILFG